MAKDRENILGTFGTVWLDGDILGEIISFEAKITAEREDILQAGTLDKGSKITSLKGEGTLKFRKVYTGIAKKLVEDWKKGKDSRSQIVGLLADPDSVRGQQERVSIGDVAFNEISVMNFEVGKVTEVEMPFTFAPSQVRYIDTIN